MPQPAEAIIASALNAPYTRVFNKEEDGGYSAWVVELRGVNAAGATIEDANQDLEYAIANWVAYGIEAGHDIPAPIGPEQYSGRLTFRIPPSLHYQAVVRAQVENVSLNRLLSDAVSRYLGGVVSVSGPRAADDVEHPSRLSHYSSDPIAPRTRIREQEPDG